ARWLKRTSNIMAIATVVAVAILAGHTVSAQITPRPPNPLASLKTVAVSEPPNLGEFVKNKSAAIALGKALFWDMQVGSNGLMSCASCHFHAGVDNRAKNQLNPGVLRVTASGEANPDITFNAGGPNSVLQPADFPFHKLANPDDRSSQVLAHTNDVVGSQGVTLAKFIDTVPGNSADKVEVVPDPVFNVQGINVRQVTERNTPSTINAVFNFRQFWDGRAQNEFNGVNPFGSRDPNAFVLKAPTRDTPLQQVKISLKNSSLASQAVGPPLSSVEESGTGRTFPEIGQKFDGIININLLGLAVPLPRDLGKKLRVLRPLGKQLVHRQDSVLGSLSLWPLRGLIKGSYENMIEEAFQRVWWDSPYIIKVDANGGTRSFRRWLGPLASDEYSLMDYNFSLFFGLAIQLYESTLISNDSPFDRFMDGNSNALTVQQQQGKALFEQSCVFCHGGAETTNASVNNLERLRLRRMAVGSGEAVYDNAFYNIGVLPTLEDLGVGGNDPFGNPLSESRLAAQGRFEQLLNATPNIPVAANERITADGAFKTPGLRNIELTGPYFHNGGQLTLLQVVEFYNRGGDFAENNDNADIGIRPLGLNKDQKTSLVLFMQSLTDERVAKERAPFDHPQLFITNGHPGDQNAVTDDGSGQATTTLIELPAVGRYGITNPQPNFLGVTSEPATTTITPPSSTNPLEGSMTEEDCPLGSILKSVIGGYMCVTK
ncbi:cytochrome c peroxidase, partial [Microcoleus sp. herbarium2]|uniref:cytochrome c peroxidase n=1 Tax=Microcoleus sp. herbarium2 TaxID=3055433 RepID=UPI002FD64D7F